MSAASLPQDASQPLMYAAGQLASEELSRRRLIDFARRVFPGFDSPAHIVYLADVLERVERGQIKLLAISAPPGHGKSSLLQCFTAWFLGRDPTRRVLALSASESLAQRNSRAVRSLLQHDAWPFNCGLNRDSTSSLEWRTEQGGGVKAVGTGGVITGYRCELIVCDDVQSDAGSDATRSSLLEWYRSIASTRLEPNGAVALICTRWHDSDLLGSLLEGENANEWTYINLPAIAQPGDVLGREEGEALWPQRWPLEQLEKKRLEVGSASFSAQYMGDPVPGGALFKPEWLNHCYDALPTMRQNLPADWQEKVFVPSWESKPILLRPYCIQSIDSAWRTGLGNDFSVVATLTSDGVNIFIADVWRGKLEYPDLRRMVLQKYQKHRPHLVYVEESSSGYAIVSDLKRSTPIPIVGVRPSESKVARASAVTALFEVAA